MGVSRRVKIYDFKACLEEGSEGMMHYPALQVGGKVGGSRCGACQLAPRRLLARAGQVGVCTLWKGALVPSPSDGWATLVRSRGPSSQPGHARTPPALPPPLQITTRSKLSSVSWNSYVKSQLITSDYSGLIQLWDASTAGEVAQFDEHARRVWSVDFSAADPMKFLRWGQHAYACVCGSRGGRGALLTSPLAC